MKSIFLYNNILYLPVRLCTKNKIVSSGNPFIKGWYADPEAAIFNNQYWIYSTWSGKFKKQVFFDAFSSGDLITWKKHERIVDTAAIKWANMAIWAPAIVEKDKKDHLFFGANNIQNNSKHGGIGVAVADKPGRHV